MPCRSQLIHKEAQAAAAAAAAAQGGAPGSVVANTASEHVEVNMADLMTSLSKSQKVPIFLTCSFLLCRSSLSRWPSFPPRRMCLHPESMSTSTSTRVTSPPYHHWAEDRAYPHNSCSHQVSQLSKSNNGGPFFY